MRCGPYDVSLLSDGSYRVGGILPGSYRLILSSRNQGLVDERYDDITCPRDSCDLALGDVFTFTGTESYTAIDATLALSFTDDFFAAIRAMYNKRASDPA